MHESSTECAERKQTNGEGERATASGERKGWRVAGPVFPLPARHPPLAKMTNAANRFAAFDGLPSGCLRG